MTRAALFGPLLVCLFFSRRSSIKDGVVRYVCKRKQHQRLLLYFSFRLNTFASKSCLKCQTTQSRKEYSLHNTSKCETQSKNITSKGRRKNCSYHGLWLNVAFTLSGYWNYWSFGIFTEVMSILSSSFVLSRHIHTDINNSNTLTGLKKKSRTTSKLYEQKVWKCDILRPLLYLKNSFWKMSSATFSVCWLDVWKGSVAWMDGGWMTGVKRARVFFRMRTRIFPSFSTHQTLPWNNPLPLLNHNFDHGLVGLAVAVVVYRLFGQLVKWHTQTDASNLANC